jgi:hypothetical protein
MIEAVAILTIVALGAFIYMCARAPHDPEEDAGNETTNDN